MSLPSDLANVFAVDDRRLNLARERLTLYAALIRRMGEVPLAARGREREVPCGYDEDGEVECEIQSWSDDLRGHQASLHNAGNDAIEACELYYGKDSVTRKFEMCLRATFNCAARDYPLWADSHAFDYECIDDDGKVFVCSNYDTAEPERYPFLRYRLAPLWVDQRTAVHGRRQYNGRTPPEGKDWLMPLEVIKQWDAAERIDWREACVQIFENDPATIQSLPHTSITRDNTLAPTADVEWAEGLVQAWLTANPPTADDGPWVDTD